MATPVDIYSRRSGTCGKSPPAMSYLYLQSDHPKLVPIKMPSLVPALPFPFKCLSDPLHGPMVLVFFVSSHIFAAAESVQQADALRDDALIPSPQACSKMRVRDLP